MISIIRFSFLVSTGLFSLNLWIEPVYRIFSSGKGTEKLFPLKYRGKVLEGEVAEAAEERGEEKGEGSVIVMRKRVLCW